jgi:ABC-type glycerol-3-phosphate transport system substrate-binding protein
MKKVLIVLFALIMLVVGCSSCNSSDKQDESQPTKENKASEQEATEEPDEVIELTIGSAGFTSTDDALCKYIEDMFGLKISAVDTQGDKLSLLATALNLPDVFVSGITNAATVNNWIEQEVIRDIPAELIEKYPLIKERFEVHVISNAFYDSKGKYYFYPVRITDAIVGSHSQYIRQDWLDNLGLDMPTSYDELYDVAYAFTHDDPDQNGKDDTYGIGGKMFTPHYINFTGASQ